jgi:hypothetical protein
MSGSELAGLYHRGLVGHDARRESQDEARYVTGQKLNIDAGRMLK